jgi:hypothetical protein
MSKALTLDEILDLAEHLSLMDKVRLIERIAPQIERELEQGAQSRPRTPILGMWQGVSITDEDIAEARREMWGNFPREDI